GQARQESAAASPASESLMTGSPARAALSHSRITQVRRRRSPVSTVSASSIDPSTSSANVEECLAGGRSRRSVRRRQVWEAASKCAVVGNAVGGDGAVGQHSQLDIDHIVLKSPAIQEAGGAGRVEGENIR